MLLAASVAGAHAASRIEVLDAEGRQIPGARVRCVHPESDHWLATLVGAALVPNMCSRVERVGPGYLSSTVDVSGKRVSCRLERGAVLHVAVDPAACRGGCVASLRSPVADSPTVSVRVPESDGPCTESVLVELPPVSVGRYVLEIVRSDDSWSCTTNLGSVDAGDLNIEVRWTEPRQLSARG